MESVLASSAVWYNSRAADAKDDLIAFASRNVIYLLNTKEKFPKYSSILRGHTERISSCSFCHSKRDDDIISLVSGSDDCTVKVWHVTMGSVLQEHDIHSPNRVTAVHWSPINKDTVLSVDEKGFVVHWNLATNKKTKYQPEGANHQPLTCVTCSPFNDNLVALGYKSGGASIVDLSFKCRIIAKMRGHSNEINSLIWPCIEDEDLVGINSLLGNDMTPESGDNLSDQQTHFQKEIIITGSKDRSIKIWSTSGKCLRTHRLVSKSAKGRRIPEESSRIFVALLWPTGSKSSFLSSSFNGDILLWDINNDLKEPPISLGSNDIDENHSRLVFNLVFDVNSQRVFSFSMDRWIKCWNVNKPLSAPEWSQPTLGGFVYAVSASPCNPSVIALGIGDGMIRLWNTQNPRDPFDVTLLWQCVKEKVMSLSWHPSKEGLLAFGTEDGKVGLFDTLSMKQPVISTTYHLRPVYSMSWGPSLDLTSGDGNVELSLYTCGGDGKVYVHHLSRKNDTSAIELNQRLRSANTHVDFSCTGRHSEIAWKADLSVLAIGNDNGLIQIFKCPDWMNIINIKVHGKIINCLSWGIGSDLDSVDTSYWLASGSNGFDVHVSDLKEAMTQNISSEGLPVSINNSFRLLSGHHSRVTSLAWSAKKPTLLASASYDGTAQVWNVLNEEPLSNYRGHDGRLLCICWNNISDNGSENGIIYSGGDDYAVHAWKMEKQEHKYPPVEALTSYSNSKFNSKKKNRSRKKKALQQGNGDRPDTARNDVFVENVYKENGDSSMAELEMKKLQLLKDLDLGDNSTENLPISINSVEDVSISKKGDETISSNDAGDSGIEPNDDKTNFKNVLADLSQQRLKAAETEKRRVRLKNLFPLSVSQDNKKKTEIQQDCVNIARYLVESRTDIKSNATAFASDNSDIDPGFFGDRLSTFKMLFCEERNHVKNNDIDAMNVLKLFRGDIVGAVTYAIENNCMSRSLVSFSPMAGFDVWQRACLAYAEQLTRDGASLHAAQYFICCNQVNRAITMLCDNKHYREAVVLARTHLLDDDPFLIETVMTWAAKLKYGGSYDLAAKCYASVGEYEKAASSISHYATLKPIPGSNEINAYLAAMSLCKTARLQNLYLDYGRRALTSILLNNVWKDTHDASCHFFKDYAFALQLIVCVHEIMLRYDSAHEKRLKSIHIDFAKESVEIDFNATDLLPAIMTSWDRIVGINNSTCAEVMLDIRTDIIGWASDKNISTTNLAIKNTILQTSIQLTAVMIEQFVKQQQCMKSYEEESSSVNAYCGTIKELASGCSMSEDEKHFLSFIADQAVSCSKSEIVL